MQRGYDRENDKGLAEHPFEEFSPGVGHLFAQLNAELRDFTPQISPQLGHFTIQLGPEPSDVPPQLGPELICLLPGAHSWQIRNGVASMR